MNVEVRKIKNEQELELAFRLSSQIFKEYMDDQTNRSYLKSTSDLDETLIAIKDNKYVIGFYFLGYNNIYNSLKQYDMMYNNVVYHEDISKYKKLRGLEGIALGVSDNYRNLGIGKKLIEKSLKLPNIDYVWGQAYDSLNNLNDWLKRRRLVADVGGSRGIHFTLHDIK